MRLDARGLTLRYGRRTILGGVDIAVGTGEFVGLIGPNGAGKSTLLCILAGLSLPDSGSVTCDGNPLSDVPRQELARRVAYLPQGGEVHWPMQAEAVVALGRLPHRAAADADRTAIARAMQATDCEAFRDRPMDTLSGGERMRVLLARALAVEAKLLLADEPIAALDPLHQLRVMTLLQHRARDGAGILAVLHDLSLAARFCDRLVLIAEGGMVAEGPPEKVLLPVHLKRAYGVEMITGSADGLSFVLPWAE